MKKITIKKAYPEDFLKIHKGKLFEMSSATGVPEVTVKKVKLAKNAANPDIKI